MSTDNTEETDTLTPQPQTRWEKLRAFWARDDNAKTFAGVVVLAALAGLVLWLIVAALSGGDTDQAPTEAEVPGVDEQALAQELSSIYEGYKPGELDVGGSNAIPDSAEERSETASFTGEALRTREDVVAFLNSDRQRAQDARHRVASALRDAGYGNDEVRLALSSGDRWIWVAPTVESQILGTTYHLDGEIVKADGWRQVAPNDAMWFYVTTDSKIVQGAALRADCANPDVDKIRPVRPGMPKAPPISEGPEKPERPERPDRPDRQRECPPDSHREGGRCVKDDQSFDEQQNDPGLPQREPQDVEPPEEERIAAENAPPEPSPSPTSTGSPPSPEDGTQEQLNTKDGSPKQGDNSSGGGEAGVVEQPSDSADSNPQHDESSEPSSGTNEDTSNVDQDTDASQNEDESNDESGSNPF